MPYKDPIKQREYDQSRKESRRLYFREYRRKHPQPYKYTKSKYIKRHGESRIAHAHALGDSGEEIALKVLVGSKKIYRPCDLDWNGKLVDVKTAKPTKNIRSIDRWKFLLSKQKGKIDLFLLIRKDKEDRVIDIHLIPDKEIRYKNISFNNNSVIKYSKYLLTL
jgi:hypothetical protein